MMGNFFFHWYLINESINESPKNKVYLESTAACYACTPPLRRATRLASSVSSNTLLQAKMSDQHTKRDPLDTLLAELLASSGGQGRGGGHDSGAPRARPTPSKVGSREAGQHVEDHDPWKALSDQVCGTYVCRLFYLSL